MIGGYIFAGKIWEARREAITKIVVLWAALVMLVVMNFPALARWGLMATEEFQATYPGTTLSTSEWVSWEMMYLDVFTFIVVVIALVLGFIGLYVGSMLKRPAKS